MDNKILRDSYLRVTKVLSPFTGIEFVPEHLLEHACDRGTRVHRHIEGILNGWSFDDVHPLVTPYVESFQHFWESSKHAFEGAKILLEHRLYCDTHKITGCPDIMIDTGRHVYIIDWKTSAKMHKSWYLQGAAYKYMAEIEFGIKTVEDVLFVKLNKGKKPTLYKSHEYREHADIFFKCLDLYRWFEMEKTRKKWESK